MGDVGVVCGGDGRQVAWSYRNEKCGWDKDKSGMESKQAWHAKLSTMSNNEREEKP